MTYLNNLEDQKLGVVDKLYYFFVYIDIYLFKYNILTIFM